MQPIARKLFALLMIATASQFSLAQDRPKNYGSKYLYGFYGKSIGWLGSEEVRVGGGLGYAVGQPEPRFAWGRIPAQLVYEGYVNHTWGVSNYKEHNTNTIALGGLAYGRWFWPQDHEGRGMYADLGWGLQYADHPTHDLDLKLNSTPVFGIGGLFPMGKREFMVGLRYMHVSNAGTKEPNQGQNQFYLLVGLRF